MKKISKLIFILLFLIPTMTFSQDPDPLWTSIDNGVAWLKLQQNPDGSWGTNEVVAHTGFALTKLCDYAGEQGTSPLEDLMVMAGFDYLFSQAFVHGPGISIASEACYHHETYNAAVALAALASLGEPTFVINSANPVVNGQTIGWLMQEMVDYFAWSQYPEGGWSYNDPNCVPGAYVPDNSHTGYVVLALRYAEVAGIPIPAEVKTKLSSFIDLIQDDITGESYYSVGWAWPNALKQGNLLIEMSFVGDAITDARDQAALAFLATLWDQNNGDPGWKDPQAMYCLMKGFESFGIETIEVLGVERDWFAEFSTYLMSTQLADGSWPYSNWADAIVSTAWALFVLEKVAPPPPIVEVDLDIHPASWPNPFQPKSKGVTPVAIVGTPDLDVTEVDFTTLLLEGVMPVKGLVTDTTTPDPDDNGCNASTAGPDGINDLIIYFNTQLLLAALGPVLPGETHVLTLTGKMMDGRDLIGDDCIIIVKKKTAVMEPSEYALMQNYPNPFRTQTRISYTLPEETQVTLKVYNLTGQEIKTLVNFRQTEGTHHADFSPADLTTGQYIYRLSTPQFTESRLMQVIK